NPDRQMNVTGHQQMQESTLRMAMENSGRRCPHPHAAYSAITIAMCAWTSSAGGVALWKGARACWISGSSLNSSRNGPNADQSGKLIAVTTFGPEVGANIGPSTWR